MLDLVLDISRFAGWSRAETLGLGLSEARAVSARAAELRERAR